MIMIVNTKICGQLKVAASKRSWHLYGIISKSVDCMV